MRRLEERIKGNLEEVITSIEFEMKKELWELDASYIRFLADVLHKIALAVDRFHEGDESGAHKILDEIEF